MDYLSDIGQISQLEGTRRMPFVAHGSRFSVILGFRHLTHEMIHTFRPDILQTSDPSALAYLATCVRHH